MNSTTQTKREKFNRKKLRYYFRCRFTTDDDSGLCLETCINLTDAHGAVSGCQ